MLTASLAAVLYLAMPTIAMGQGGNVGRPRTDTLPKLKAQPIPEQEKRFVPIFGKKYRFIHICKDCALAYGCPELDVEEVLYEPDVEYVVLSRPRRVTPQFPCSVLSRYTHNKELDERWKMPSMVEIEDVDGVKFIKKDNDYE